MTRGAAANEQLALDDVAVSAKGGIKKPARSQGRLAHTIPSTPIMRAVESVLRREGIPAAAARCGVPERKIRGARNGERRFRRFRFETADRLVVNLLGPEAWWTDPELRSIYLGEAQR